MLNTDYIVRIYNRDLTVVEYPITAATCSKAEKEALKKFSYFYDGDTQVFGGISKVVVIRRKTDRVVLERIVD